MTASGNSHSNKVYSNASLDELHKIFRHDTWFIIRNVYERLKGIDWVKFLACDVIKKVCAYGNVIQNINQSDLKNSISILILMTIQNTCNSKVTDHLEKIRVVSASSSSTSASAGNPNVDPLGRIFSSNNDQPLEPPVFHVQPFLLEVGSKIIYSTYFM